MEEAIASSQLEGAATTRKFAKQMLESNRKPRNCGEQMIANNYLAKQWIVQNKKTPVTESSILELHHLITKDTLVYKQEEGAFVQLMMLRSLIRNFRQPPYRISLSPVSLIWN